MRITLTPSEREIILKYGYPSFELEERLKRLRASDRSTGVDMETFEPQKLAGDLSLSLTEGRIAASDTDVADALCNRLAKS